jgi:ribosomal protein S18 acetylase RimI-like enzyme
MYHRLSQAYSPFTNPWYEMIEIREATVGDVPAIAEVHVKADWDTYAPLFGAEAYKLTVAESEDRWRQALEGGGLLLVATDRGVIIGLGHACAGRIDALYLLSAYHRRGIGKALLAGLLRFLQERGVSEAQLDVVTVNANAIAFYRTQGARQIGRRINKDPRGDTENLIFAISTAKQGGQTPTVP